jgi:hypothetical protein
MSVRTSQESHFVSATEPNRLILFKETVAVYCENHAEHTDPVRTSQETHYVSATEPNRLILFRETVAVYCENHTERTDTLCGQNAVYFDGLTDGGYSYHWSEASITVSVHSATYIIATFVTFTDRSSFVKVTSYMNWATGVRFSTEEFPSSLRPDHLWGLPSGFQEFCPFVHEADSGRGSGGYEYLDLCLSSPHTPSWRGT